MVGRIATCPFYGGWLVRFYPAPDVFSPGRRSAVVKKLSPEVMYLIAWLIVLWLMNK